ncbi:YqaJ viral recombinase family protein [bacterium]|nr:YqaJ viral recombinase family protein [bacterium]
MMNHLDPNYRRTGIGGSDIGAILGVNPFRSPLDVYMDKLGLKEPEPDNEKMRWGRVLERPIAEEFCRNRSLALLPTGHLRTEIDGVRVFGTPDFIVQPKSAILEIKTAGLHMAGFWGEPGTDNAPLPYIAQVALYLMLEGVTDGYIAALIGGQDYREYEIPRDRELEAAIKDAVVTFWKEHVIPQVPPEARTAEEYQRFLKARYPRSTGEMVVADSVAALRMRELAKVRAELKTLEAQETDCMTYLQGVIADNDGIESEEFAVTWKSVKDSESVDTKALLADPELPRQLIEKYKVTKPGSRRFLFKEKKRPAVAAA